MKNFKHFMFAFVPLLLVLGIQFLASYFAMGLSMLIESGWSAFSGANYFEVMNDVNDLWMTSDFNSGILLVYNTICIAVFGVWYYTRYGGDYLPKLRRTFHPFSVLGILMLVPGTQYLTTYIMSFTASLFPGWMDTYEELLETAGLDEHISILMLICSIVFAPFCEEFVFRGVAMKQLMKCLPFWAANLIQAVFFGVFHMNMIQGIYAGCLGLILGYVCEKGGSIYYSILLHILFNFWGTVISQYLWIGDSLFSVMFWFVFGIAMTAGGLLVFGLGIRERDSRNALSQEV